MLWRLRAWDDEAVQRAWLDHGFVSMSGDALGDMGGRPDRGEIKARLQAAFPEAGARTIAVWAGYWVAFLSIAIGDEVLVPLVRREAALARATGPYRYVADEPHPRLRHRYEVEWLDTGSPRDALPEHLRRAADLQGTISRVRPPGGAGRR